MLRSVAELAAYGTLAVLLTAAMITPQVANTASSAATGDFASNERPSIEAAERGALLFATKGCVGCHTHGSFPNAHMEVGPDLTALSQRAPTRVAGLDARAYVRQSLREPGAYRVAGYGALMPEIALTDLQIESLTTFLLSSTP